MAGTPLPRIGAPATRAFEQRGITSLEDLRDVDRNDALGWHGVGPKAVRLLDDALAANELGWSPTAT